MRRISVYILVFEIIFFISFTSWWFLRNSPFFLFLLFSVLTENYRLTSPLYTINIISARLVFLVSCYVMFSYWIVYLRKVFFFSVLFSCHNSMIQTECLCFVYIAMDCTDILMCVWLLRRVTQRYILGISDDINF